MRQIQPASTNAAPASAFGRPSRVRATSATLPWGRASGSRERSRSIRVLNTKRIWGAPDATVEFTAGCADAMIACASATAAIAIGAANETIACREATAAPNFVLDEAVERGMKRNRQSTVSLSSANRKFAEGEDARPCE